jgi:uridine monophosphate synthetase
MKVVNSDGTPTFATRIFAGVSGIAIQELALDFIKTASTIIQKENLNLVLIGVGGITMASHFSQFFAAGATIALSATGMMYNPYLAAEYHKQTYTTMNTPNINIEKIKKELAHKLFDIGVIKFGDFTFKSGIRSNNYVDMRIAISHPDILQELAICLKDIQQKCHADILCAVPYAALPVTTALSMISGTPMIMARKEAKDHGTKNMVEGTYVPGQECLMIEDVITTGSSILETIKTVEATGLKVKDVVVLIDRQQGGTENIAAHGYRLHSIFTLQELLNLLKESHRISQETVDMVRTSCEQTEHTVPHNTVKKNHSLTYKQRAAYCVNLTAQRLHTIIETKKTNLVFSADITNKTNLLQLANLIGPEICVLKIHCDIIDDFNQDFPEQLRSLADKHNFLIWEDRKFADIGSTTLQQYIGGISRIADWADIVTVHSIAGNGTIEALRSTSATKNSAFLLIAQMSSAQALTQQPYTDATVKLALEYPENVIGVICRQKLSDNPGLLHVTPGVQLAEGGDAFGQQYLTPEKVINELGSDIIVVGRGISQAQDPLNEAQRYRKAGWDAYQQKINQK